MRENIKNLRRRSRGGLEQGVSPKTNAATAIAPAAEETLVAGVSRRVRPWPDGQAVYVDTELVLRALARVAAMKTDVKPLGTLLTECHGSEKVIPSDINAEYVGRFLLSIKLGRALPLLETGQVSPLAPGLPIQFTGLVASSNDVTPTALVVSVDGLRLRVIVRREEFLHLNRLYFSGKHIRVLGIVRSVPRSEVSAALILCDDNGAARP